MSLIDRLILSKHTLTPVFSDIRVLFEDGVDSPLKIMTPDPHWMAAALAGGIIPPVGVYRLLNSGDIDPDIMQYILNECPPAPEMTETQAIEYLVQKDLPLHIWDDHKGNARRFIMCNKAQLPTDRNFRGSWAIEQDLVA